MRRSVVSSSGLVLGGPCFRALTTPAFVVSASGLNCEGKFGRWEPALRFDNCVEFREVPFVAFVNPTFSSEPIMVSPIPEGYGTVTSYLIVPNSEEAIAFYQKAFGAKQIEHMPMPGGGTLHAEIQIGNSRVMLSDENPDWQMPSAKTLGGSPVSMMIYCDDCDADFQRAVDAGCEVKAPVGDMFWGDRMGKVEDPFGFQWAIATHKEDLTPEQLDERRVAWVAEMMKGGG